MKYDFHIHSCLSPCGDNDMTPANIAGMAMLAGYDVVALSDHGSCKNCRSFLAACREHGLVALPAMEFTTAEEVHVLCLFDDIDAAERFDAFAYSHLPDIKNEPEFFGEQLIVDENDNVISSERKLLINATDIGIYHLRGIVEEYGGIAIPAHIDRDSFSVLANLGYFDPSMGYEIVELSQRADIGELLKSNPELLGLRFIQNSDAHALFAIPDAQRTIEVNEKSPTCVIDALKSKILLPTIHPN